MPYVGFLCKDFLPFNVGDLWKDSTQFQSQLSWSTVHTTCSGFNQFSKTVKWQLFGQLTLECQGSVTIQITEFVIVSTGNRQIKRFWWADRNWFYKNKQTDTISNCY